MSLFLEAIEKMAKTLKLFGSQIIFLRFRDEQVLFCILSTILDNHLYSGIILFVWKKVNYLQTVCKLYLEQKYCLN